MISFSWLKRIFSKQNLKTVAMSLLPIGAKIMTGIIPGELDDDLVQALRERYPNWLATDKAASVEELKLAATGAVTLILKREFPGLTTTDAMIAVLEALRDSKKPA